MPFYEALEEMEAPEKEARRDLREYKEYLDLLPPGKQHYLYVKKGEPVLRKVKALDEKGEEMFIVDESTGKKVALYATLPAADGTPGEPRQTGIDGVQYVTEDTGRGKTEMADCSGLVAAGAEEDINVSVKATQMGKGYTRKHPDTGVIEWVPDDAQPEKTRLRVIRGVKRTDNPEGTLRKKGALADRRMKDVQAQLKRATTAPQSYKKELQDKIKKYREESLQAGKDLEALLAANGKAPVAEGASK